MDKRDLIKLGSKTAKDGFKNEQEVIDKFNNWKEDLFAKEWLGIMNYSLSDIEFVKAVKVPGHFKADVQVKVFVKLKELADMQHIQVKLVSNPQGFNQIDKRWVDSYITLWNIPEDISIILKTFTGELKSANKKLKDPRREFFSEMSKTDQDKVIKFFSDNRIMVVSDLIKGRGEFSADWVLVIFKNEDSITWMLKSINEAMNVFGRGNIEITSQGNLRIGNIAMQRKGGDGGRKSANMLQFKINPVKLLHS